MAEEPPKAAESDERVENRGTPPGKGTITPAHGGRIGNPPFEPTEEQRLQVRTLAKVCSIPMITQVTGLKKDVLHKYFQRDLDLGKAEAVATIGAKLLEKAMGGNLTAMIFFLRTQGKWNTRVELANPDGTPLMRPYDLSGIPIEQKRLLLPILDALMGQHAPEEEPDGGPERLH